MKPSNTRPALLLDDGAPTNCDFMARTDPPRCWERCEQDATQRLTHGEVIRFDQWRDDHPHAIIWLYPGNTQYLCDRHTDIVRECL